MDCARAKEELSAYLDDMLEPDEKRQLEQHIASCPSCKEDLAKLKSYAKTMAGLPKVKAPDDFLKKVKERIERRSDFESVMRGFFKPSANKTRAGAALVTVVMIFAIYKIVAPKFSLYKMEPVAEKRAPVTQAQDLDALERKVSPGLGAGVEYEASAPAADLVPVESAPMAEDALNLAEKQDAGLTHEEYMKMSSNAMPEVRSLIKLHARLTAVHADGSPMSLDDATAKVMQCVDNEGGTFGKLDSHEARQVRLHFTIPAAAYSNLINQLEQIASVEGPDSSTVSDAGSIDVDLIVQ